MKNFYCLILIALVFSLETHAQAIQKTLIKAFTSQDSSDYYFKVAKKSIKTTADEAQYYFCKNARCCDYSELDSAIVYGEKAIKLLQKGDDINSLLTVYINMAKVYRKQGQYDKAIDYSIQGMKIAENAKKDKWIAYFNNYLSLTYHDFESYPKGIFYGKKALSYWESQKKKSPDMIGSALNSIAINFDDWNKPDSALYYHKKVFKYYKGKDTMSVAETYNNIGNTLLKQKKYKEAKRWISSALKINDKNFEDNNGVKDSYYHYERATNYTNLATIESELGNFGEAEKLFAKAQAFAVNSKNAEKLRDFYYQRAQFNKKRKDLAQVVKDQENYIKLRDSVFATEREQTFSELEAKYQNEKKETQLLKSKAEISERKIEIESKNTQFLILGLVALALLIIVFLVYRQQKLKNKQQEQEFELKSAIGKIETQNKLQEQRLTISRDLHDNIGSQLTFIISSVDNIKYAFDIQNDKLDRKLSGISEFAKSTIVELRDTIWAMNKSEITFEDLQARIHNFINRAKEAKEDIRFHFDVDKSLTKVKFTSVEGMNLYRTIQEAINNSVKHANAKSISISISPEPDGMRITIIDDGHGFDLEHTEFGNGLHNMRKRISDIGGSFEINADPVTGTAVTIALKKGIDSKGS